MAPTMMPTADAVGSFTFDPMKEVHTGIVLGIGTGSLRNRNAEGKVEDFFFIRPGDDVSVTFPNAATLLEPSIRFSPWSTFMRAR